MLLGIKYVSLFNKGENIKEYNKIDDYQNDYFDIYENPYNLSLGYVINNKDLDLKYEENNNAFLAQNNILRAITGIEKDVYTPHNGEVLKNTQAVEAKDYNYVQSGENPKIIYEFEAESEENIYLYIIANDDKDMRIFINEEEKGLYFTNYGNEMVNLGKRKIGEKIKLEFCLEADETNLQEMYIYYENEEVLLEHYDKLKENQIDFEEKSSREFIRKNKLK